MPYDIFSKYNFDDIDDNASLTDNQVPEWKQVAVKSVRDSDGFMTEYVWYTDGDKHIFMFGDSDLVEPDESYADWTCETEKEAKEWFDSYNGFEEDEDDESFFDSDMDECVLTESYRNLPDWLTQFLDTKNDGKKIKLNLSNKGVDLYNCSYTRAPFPRSNRDPILKDDSKLKIFKLLDGSREVIYIYGINNPYIKRPNSSEWRYTNEMPMRDILDLAIEFGYIDLSEPENTMRDKRRERRNKAYSLRDVTRDPKAGLSPVYHHTYGKKEDGRTDWDNITSTSVSWVTKKGYDKSGYKLDPDKYRRMLDNVGLETYSARLQSFYNKIEDVRSRIVALMNTMKFDVEYDYRSRSSFSDGVFSDIAEATDKLSRAMDYYQRIKRNCAEVVEKYTDAQSEEDIERANSAIKYSFSYDGDSFNSYISSARDLVKGLEAAQIKQ